MFLQLMSRPNWCKPPVDSNEEASASWLNPPIATSSSWLHPDVASGPVKRKTTDDAPKAALLQKLPRWTAPSPSEDFASAAETPPGQTPHIVLSVGTALLACGEQALDLAEALKKKNAEFGKDILAPCSFGRGADGCTACDKLDVEWLKEYNTFMCVWNAMTTEMKTVLFSTVYDESNQSRSSSRVVWQFCDKRVCLARLCNLLHITPRTFYKRVNGEVDKRKFNTGACADVSRTVDAFMLDLYHTTAEFLPELTEYHVSCVDEELAAHEKLTEEETKSLEKLGKDDTDFLPLIGADPDKGIIANMQTVAADGKLPKRYIQHSKVIDLFWMYISWLSTRSPDTKPASWSTFWRRWCGCWRESIGLRGKTQHSQCDFCFKCSHYIHGTKATPMEKKQRALQWAEHLRAQYLDRMVYYHLRFSSKLDSSPILCVIYDGMDKSKFYWPKWGMRTPKNADKFVRPKCELHLALAHGYLADFYVSNDDGGHHGASYAIECIIQTLAKVQSMRRERGLPMCRHLVIQSDNTVAQCKNQYFCLFLGVLTRRFAFSTVQLTCLRKGHTHEDIDFIFSLVLGRVIRKMQFFHPQDLVNAIPAGMSGLMECKGYQVRSSMISHVRNFQPWLDKLGSTPYNCFQTRQNIPGPHSFTFKLRMDLSESERNSLSNRRVVREGSDLDVFCVTKPFNELFYLGSTSPSHQGC